MSWFEAIFTSPQSECGSSINYIVSPSRERCLFPVKLYPRKIVQKRRFRVPAALDCTYSSGIPTQTSPHVPARPIDLALPRLPRTYTWAESRPARQATDSSAMLMSHVGLSHLFVVVGDHPGMSRPGYVSNESFVI